MNTKGLMQRHAPELAAWALTRVTRLITGAPVPVQRIYFGNHNRHADSG